ncbi:MAG: hypothetical protein HQL30_08975 [Candidatus Omnitrophica bacterium]|nr:hypothetical protein [Candidatus Omnitrophota bacterium]
MNELRKQNFIWMVMFLAVAVVFGAGCGKKTDKQSAEQSKAAEKPAEEMQAPSTKPITEERTFYGFENDLQGWEIPAWAEGKNDYVAETVSQSKDFASEGTASMKVMANFPGGNWTAALVEIQQYLDISFYRAIRVDVYVPADAPEGLKASLILTVGNNWKFVEMNQNIPLSPGKWVTITGNIEPGSYDWKRVVPDTEFGQDVRKIAVRVMSNRQPQYNGPIYIDNIRVGK